MTVKSPQASASPGLHVPSVLDRIVPGGLCIGCGICAGLSAGGLEMRRTGFGAYEPHLRDSSSVGSWGPVSLSVCPFADRDANEDSLGRELFAGLAGAQKVPETGYYLACYAGSVTDERARLSSASGGLLSWTVGELLRQGLVDAALCVGSSDSPDRLFEYRIVRTREELLARCRKSRYYPVECSRVLEEVLNSRERFCFVGLPCFCKGIRLAMLQEPALRERIRYVAGLVCGHLKTAQFAQYLSRRCGVGEDAITAVDFRKKVPGRCAWDYDFQVTRRSGGPDPHRSIRMSDVFAGNWGYTTFMVDACDWCDDVFAELADVAVGDAWLPQFVTDYRGASIAICRRGEFAELYRQGLASGELALQPIPIEQVIHAQEGALRHRRDGLAYRLYLAGRGGRWRPRKRLKPDGRSLPVFYKCVQRLRLRLSRLSKQAYLRQQEKGGTGVGIFVRSLWPWVTIYDILYAWRTKVHQAQKLVRLITSKLDRRDGG